MEENVLGCPNLPASQHQHCATPVEIWLRIAESRISASLERRLEWTFVSIPASFGAAQDEGHAWVLPSILVTWPAHIMQVLQHSRFTPLRPLLESALLKLRFFRFDWISAGAAGCKATKHSQPPFPIKMTQVLELCSVLLTIHEGQSTRVSLGVAESPLHWQQGQKGKLTEGITVPHTSTHFRRGKKGKKSQASKRKRAPLLVYTSPSTWCFMGWVFRHASCWVLLATDNPTGIWKQTTVYSRQKENTEPLRWKMSWKNRATPPAPTFIPRPVQKGQTTLRGHYETMCHLSCSWHFAGK